MMIMIFLRAYVTTVLLESVCLFVWDRAYRKRANLILFNKRNFLYLLLVNTITNPLLVLVMLIVGTRVPYIQTMKIELLLEILVLLGEAVLIKLGIKEIKNPFWFSVSANVTSFMGPQVIKLLIGLVER